MGPECLTGKFRSRMSSMNRAPTHLFRTFNARSDSSRAKAQAKSVSGWGPWISDDDVMMRVSRNNFTVNSVLDSGDFTRLHVCPKCLFSKLTALRGNGRDPLAPRSDFDLGERGVKRLTPGGSNHPAKILSKTTRVYLPLCPGFWRNGPCRAS